MRFYIIALALSVLSMEKSFAGMPITSITCSSDDVSIYAIETIMCEEVVNCETGSEVGPVNGLSDLLSSFGPPKDFCGPSLKCALERGELTTTSHTFIINEDVSVIETQAERLFSDDLKSFRTTFGVKGLNEHGLTAPESLELLCSSKTFGGDPL
jgi:hypothetical protein